MPKHNQTTNPYLTFSFLALIFWLPLPLGSNRAWAWSLMELWVFSIAILAAILYLRGKLNINSAFKEAKPILILLVSFLVWLVIQLLPLPLPLIELISPYAAATAKIVGNLNYTTISLDPDVTTKSLLKSFSFMLMFMLMLLLINSRKKLEWFAYTIIAAGLFQAAYGSFMVLTGLEYSFFFEKESYQGSATGTFINRNHLAGYLEMSLAVGIGMMISKLSSNHSQTWRELLRTLLQFFLSPKILIRLALIISCIGLIITHSRMGNTAFFASLFITGSLFLLISKHATRNTTLFLMSLIILDIILIGSWVGLNKVVERLEGTSIKSETRDEVVRDSMVLIAEQPLTGIGAGNFSAVFPSYQQRDIPANYYHAHNDYMEFLSEFGFIGTCLLALAVLYSLILAFKAMRQRHSPLLLGMAFSSFMGILSILIHSSVDFNLQVPANAAMFLMLMALAVLSFSLSSSKSGA